MWVNISTGPQRSSGGGACGRAGGSRADERDTWEGRRRQGQARRARRAFPAAACGPPGGAVAHALSMVPTPSLSMASTSRSVSWLAPLPAPFSLLAPAVADSALTAALASSPATTEDPARSVANGAAGAAGAGDGGTGRGGFASCGLPGEVLPALGPSVILFLAAGATASSAQPRERAKRRRERSACPACSCGEPGSGRRAQALPLTVLRDRRLGAALLPLTLACCLR